MLNTTAAMLSEGIGPSQGKERGSGDMRQGNFSKRRQNHAVYTHKKDSFIEWIKSVLMSTFDMDIMEEQIPILLEKIEALVMEHLQDEDTSRLRRIIPDIPTLWTPLRLREAFLIYNKKYRITKRQFVYPTFNEIRHVVNLSQVLGLEDLKLMTFDGDQTLYPDQKNFDDMYIAQQLFTLLQSGVAIALVTAANYSLDGPKYEVRLRGLLDYFKKHDLKPEFREKFFVVAGESNFLLKVGPDFHVTGAQDQWPIKHELTDNMLVALDTCEQCLRTAVTELNMKAQILRKKTSVGCIQARHAAKPGEESYYFRREQLDELVFRLQMALVNIKDKIDFPYCAFNGGNDVWFDIGNKKEGIAGLQMILGLEPNNCLHVGDQMARTGNDFMARFISPVCWIVNPSETKKILKHVIRKKGFEKRGLNTPKHKGSVSCPNVRLASHSGGPGWGGPGSSTLATAVGVHATNATGAAVNAGVTTSDVSVQLSPTASTPKDSPPNNSPLDGPNASPFSGGEASINNSSSPSKRSLNNTDRGRSQQNMGLFGASSSNTRMNMANIGQSTPGNFADETTCTEFHENKPSRKSQTGKDAQRKRLSSTEANGIGNGTGPDSASPSVKNLSNVNPQSSGVGNGEEDLRIDCLDQASQSSMSSATSENECNDVSPSGHNRVTSPHSLTNSVTNTPVASGNNQKQ